MRAIWNGVTIADSDETVIVEGNHYFPPESVRWDHLQPSDATTTCPWKGQAGYYTVTAEGRSRSDAAWSYPQPKPAASEIKDHVAFWRGVKVVDDGESGDGAGRGARSLLARLGLGRAA